MRHAVLAGMTIVLSGAILATAVATPSEASFRRPRSDYADGEIIVAHSRLGNGSIEGQVRSARYGWEVRLPHGTWVSCRRSCEETLRVQTVDLYDPDNVTGYGTAQSECGLLGCLSLGF